MKRGIKIQIQLTNKWLYFLVGVLIISVLGVGVWAYNSAGTGGNPAIMGHSADEISGGVPVGADYVIESWKSADNTSWYRKYKSGWIEQGGWISSSSSSVIFPTPFNDSCLSFIASKYGAMDPCSYYFGTNQLTKMGAVIIWGGNGWGCGGTVITRFYWEAKGY